MNIFIDDREQKRGKRAYEYYTNETDYPVQIQELVYGDYVFKSDEIEVAFEYKTMEDYISSIDDNRVFNQALNQSNVFDYHFVIVEGDGQDYDHAVKKHGYHTGHYIGMETWNGSIASLVNFTGFLISWNEGWSFDLMLRIAEKCTVDEPVVHRFNKSRGSPAFRLLVNNVNRIGKKKAKLICDTLDLQTVDDVFGLSVDDLVKVKGVGRIGAVSILSQLKRCYV